MADRREYLRAWRAANRDKTQAYYEQTREQRLAYARNYRNANRESVQASRRRSDTARRHGPDVAAWFDATWEKQQGLCYLCELPLADGKQIHIDHDHGCCPSGASCQNCRRGLTHGTCNTIIGMAAEDPERLRIIAANLERVLT